MTASEIYKQETGRESHTKAGFANVAYVEWLERIVAMTAGMLNIVPSKHSLYSNDDLEELHNQFSRIV